MDQCRVEGMSILPSLTIGPRYVMGLEKFGAFGEQFIAPPQGAPQALQLFNAQVYPFQ